MHKQIYLSLAMADLQRSQDHGFLCGHGFDDPDGHIWEPMYMGPSPAGAA
jgi:predicted lactoylglutathione lyase